MNVPYSLRKKLRACNNPDLGWSVIISVFETTGNNINQQIFTMFNAVKPRSMDTHLIRTSHYYGHPHNMDTSLLWTPTQYGHLIIMETHTIWTPHYYGDPLNMDTSLVWTVCFVPGEGKRLHFL